MTGDLDYDGQPEFNLIDMRAAMMDMIYREIMIDIDGAIKANTPISEKINALNTVLKHFEAKEEYEKCSNIKKIIDEIHANNSSSKR